MMYPCVCDFCKRKNLNLGVDIRLTVWYIRDAERRKNITFRPQAGKEKDYIMKNLGKRYGDEKTNLTLTDKAYACYSVTDPISIYERETDEGFRYALRGFDDCDNLTAEQVNATLEEIYDLCMEDED